MRPESDAYYEWVMDGDLTVGELVAFNYHWRHRHQSPILLLTAEEAEFSAPALALEERPVSPTLRLTAHALLVLVALTLVWAIVGRVDIVVSATGKVIPSGRTKTIASEGVWSGPPPPAADRQTYFGRSSPGCLRSRYSRIATLTSGERRRRFVSAR
jgi:hypothetical protein